MDIKKIISVISSAAPGIATSLGGPAAGMAVSLLSNLFGADPKNPDDLIQKIQSDPDAQIKLKQLEVQQLEIAKKYDAQEFQAEVDDIKNAREFEFKLNQLNKIHIWVIPFFGILITFGFFSVIAIVMLTKMDQSDHDVLYAMIGVLGATFSQFYQYITGKWAK